MYKTILLPAIAGLLIISACSNDGKRTADEQKSQEIQQEELRADSMNEMETQRGVYPDYSLGLEDGSRVEYYKDSPEFYFVEMMKQKPDPAVTMGVYTNIRFNAGTAIPADMNRYSEIVNNFSNLIRLNPGYQFELIGSTDPGVVDDKTLTLSKNRAVKFRQDLINAGVSADKLVASSADTKYPGAADDLNAVNPLKRTIVVRPFKKI